MAPSQGENQRCETGRTRSYLYSGDPGALKEKGMQGRCLGVLVSSLESGLPS